VNKEGLMDKWIDGLVRAISIPRSSRRKEAPFCVAAPGQDQLEPPSKKLISKLLVTKHLPTEFLSNLPRQARVRAYVGCYNMVGFQREHETFGPRPFSLHQSNNPIIHQSNQSAAPC